MHIYPLVFSSGAAAQSLSMVAGLSAMLLPSNPGGAVPVGVSAPNTSGFIEPTIHPARGGLAVCVSGIVPVQAVSTTNMRLNFSIPQNQSQVTQTFLSMGSSGSAFVEEIMGSMQGINGTYNISATLCTPANNTSPSTIQILTHGIGFDRYYWDFAPGYSYVDSAAEYGHATFFYDRLGVGKSSKPDAIQVVQTPLELEILQALITKIKGGSFGTYSSVVGTGHSFGSILTQGITTKYPESLSAAILTGFSTNSSGQTAFLPALNLAIASQNAPYRFSDLTNGYLVSSNAISNQIAFFWAQDFDPAMLNIAEATKGTVTFGELFTQTAVTKPAMNYTGAVAVVNGAEDLPFCSSNCTFPRDLAQAAIQDLFPNAAKTGTYLAPLTGHGLNLHYSAVAAYNYIQEFIANSTMS